MSDDEDGDDDLFALEGAATEAETRGPRVDVPSVRNPAESLPDPSTVDADVQRSFWMAVVYANVALLGVSLGLMLIGFRGQWRWGGGAVLVGLLAGVRVYQTYRAFEQRREERATANAVDDERARDEDARVEKDSDAVAEADDDADGGVDGSVDGDALSDSDAEVDGGDNEDGGNEGVAAGGDGDRDAVPAERD